MLRPCVVQKPCVKTSLINQLLLCSHAAYSFNTFVCNQIIKLPWEGRDYEKGPTINFRTGGPPLVN